MRDLIDVKVNLPEFTFRDEKGYHTVVGFGKVPRDNMEVKEALQKGWLEEVKPAEDPGEGRPASSGKKR
jgi:hypothetical protein